MGFIPPSNTAERSLPAIEYTLELLSSSFIQSPIVLTLYLEYERARVKWFLSINSENLPNEAIAENKMTYRSIIIGDRELEFSSGFTDLHVQSYQSILVGDGFGISENRAAIKTVERIRNQAVVNATSKAHSLLENVIRG